MATPRHSAEKLVGQLIQDKYRVDRVLGMGGMGVVVAATQLQLDRTVAIKLVRQDMAADSTTVERLLQEAKAAARIRNEHVAHVLDFGTLPGGAPFIVMEYLEGDDLAKMLHKEGPLDIPQAIDLLLQACEAVGEAHLCGIVHRDLKPGNLFVARLLGGSPCLKVVDFGISKQVKVGTLQVALTTSPRILGTPNYMAPEQMRGHSSGPQADIWALGAILFEMLTGRQAFEGDTLPRLCQKVLTGKPSLLRQYRPDAPEKLERIISRCLSKKLDERFEDIAQLARKLAPFGRRRARLSLEHVLAMAETTNPGRTEAKPRKKAAPVAQAVRVQAVRSGSPKTLQGTPRPGEAENPRSSDPNAPTGPASLGTSGADTSAAYPSNDSDDLGSHDSGPPSTGPTSLGPPSEPVPDSVDPNLPSTLAGLPHSVNALPPASPRRIGLVAIAAGIGLLLVGATLLSLRNESPTAGPQSPAASSQVTHRSGLQPASRTVPTTAQQTAPPPPPSVARAIADSDQAAPEQTQTANPPAARVTPPPAALPNPPTVRQPSPKLIPLRRSRRGQASDPWDDQNFGSRL